MCGIAGYVGFEGHDTEEMVARFSAMLAHRGPDDRGFLSWTPQSVVTRSRDPQDARGHRVGLMHRRLSILDLSELGWQPMSTPDDRLHMIFNGEIYNYVELRDELRRSGNTFRSDSDTEVLLAAISAWGCDALKRLEGMFALALLDTTAGTLTLARDFFGIKPLFYTNTADGFAFASEMAPLVQLPGVSTVASSRRVLDYLLAGRTDDSEQTMIEAVKQVPPATMLVINIHSLACHSTRFWEVPSSAERIDASDEHAAGLVRDAFQQSVTRHLRSDVPVGAALSGGIDSSSIVGCMRAISPSLELHAFSYVADDVRISEERWIDLSSKAVGAHLHKIRMVSDDLPSQLDRLILRQGEPFGSSSILAQYRIFEAAAEDGIRVMLDGQGADEMLGGYSPFLAPRVASLVHRGSLLSAWSLVQELKQYGDADVPYIKRYVTASLIPQSVKRLLRGFVHDAQLPAWVNRAYLEQQELAFTAHVKDPGPDLRRHLSSALHGGLQALLRYEDRNSMAHSIESRVPFLTPSMVELLLRLPDEQIIDQRGCRKAVFRRAMRGLVPDAILDRRDKIGFQTPQAKWLDQEQSWVNGILVSEAARSIRVWNHDKMLCAVTSKDDPAASSMRTWRFLNLSRWVELNNVRFE